VSEAALRFPPFFRRGPALLVTLILAVEIALFYIAPTAEYLPHPPPLSSFQRDIGSWKMVRELELDSETESFLKADDTLTRAYAGSDGLLTLFVAFFKSQRGGVTPHSPKICLPGAGWTPEEASIISVSVPGEARPIPVNRYIVRHGEARSLVLYWYSTAHHAMADEYAAKLYLMYEGLRYRRSDEAVFRVIVPISTSEHSAEQAGLGFIRLFYESMKRQIWT
jgi:EpsI family protein